MSDEPRSGKRIVPLLILFVVAAGVFAWFATRNTKAVPDETEMKADTLRLMLDDLEAQQDTEPPPPPPPASTEGGPTNMRQRGG